MGQQAGDLVAAERELDERAGIDRQPVFGTGPLAQHGDEVDDRRLRLDSDGA
jgi:hypothetical protein